MLRIGLLGALAFVLFVPIGCTLQPPIETLPAPREILDSLGRRLAKSYREADITAFARDGRKLLGVLRADERYALGRNLIRFQVDRPTVVLVAAPIDSEPFWLHDQGFQATGERITRPGSNFSLYSKVFAAGWVGLGVNSLDRSPSTHYFALLRAVDGSRVRVTGLTGASMVDAPKRASPFLDDSGPPVALPLAFADATLLQTALSTRLDGSLLRERAWKTRVPSSTTPDQVVVALGAAASRSIAITWRTSPESTTSSVQIALANANRSAPKVASPLKLVRGGSSLVRSDGLVNDPVIRRHRVVVDGLEPDTEYVYAIADAASGTRWQSVRTAPEPSNESDLHFLSMGDPQCGLEEWGKLLHSAHKRHPESSFLLIAGDLVDRGNERTNWDHFFLRAKGVFDELPLMPAVGNHEYLDEGPRLFRSFFALPPNGPPESLVYSFEAGDALFAVLDSEAASHNLDSANLQANWLDSTLEKSPRTWKFVMFHHPLYPSHASRPVAANLKDAWLPVIDKHHVDIVFQGHDHAYLRTVPLRADQPDREGTTYVVSVSGTKYSPATRRDYAARFRAETSTYEVVDILAKEHRLVFRSFDAGGNEVDRLQIDKSSHEPSGLTLDSGD